MPWISKLIRAAALTAAAVGYVGTVYSAPAACPASYIRMVIPQPAGGVGDLVGRVLGNRVAEILGQPTVIENRLGATAAVGTAEALADPTVQERLIRLGFTAELRGAAKSEAFIKAEASR
jgi:tripartite-type tricarboxylate transporter receptor subunit TctC